MIDVHTHLYRWPVKGEPAFEEDELLQRMDELGIDRAVILPAGVSPECSFFHYDTSRVLEACNRHPDRFIPFCSLDPRNGGGSPDTDFSWILEEYKDAGCRGLGEVMANLYFDDPLCMNLFRQCGEAGLPVLFHLQVARKYGVYGLADDLGMPRLEKMLKEFPDTVFIGHANGFWAEISADVTDKAREGYPEGPVAPGGRVPELLRKYPNLYGDFSARSGFNAISRDPEFGYGFIEEFQDRLLFGTDLCHVDQPEPIVPYIRKSLAEGRMSPGVFQKLTVDNTTSLLSL